MDFRSLLKKQTPLIFDGAMGTVLMQKGFGHQLAEKLNIQQPDVIYKIHQEYVDAGVNIIETNTFNGSLIKLKELGLVAQLEEINVQAVKLAKKAAGQNVLVAGSIGPTGKLLEPLGTTTFDEAYESYKAQASALLKGGVDLFMIETISDIQEMRAALIAVKEISDLPVICSMTFDEQGRLLTGSDIFTAATTISQLGGDVFSINCSFGPDGILQTYKKFYQELGSLNIPLMVMPNAGMPEIINEETVYTMTPERFAKIMDGFRELGISIYAGCCGTTPAHISALAKKVKGQPITFHHSTKKDLFFTSRTKVVRLSKTQPFLKIGETLNPTARKRFALELKEGQEAFLREQAKEQTADGADLLDINTGIPGLDSAVLMKQCVQTLTNITSTPLCIDSDNIAALEAGLKNYPGIALINSVNGKQSSLEKVVPLAKKYGANLIALALDEKGIPEKAAERILIVHKIIAYLKKENFDIDKLFIDGLVMSVASNPDGPEETIKTTAELSKLNIKSSLGVSNVSFGLPERKNINNVFLKLLTAAGLNAGIISVKTFTEIKEKYTTEEQLAEDVLLQKDIGAKKYINYINSKKTTEQKTVLKTEPKTDLEKIFSAIVNGEESAIIGLVAKELTQNKPQSIIDQALLPALDQVGQYYSEGTYYLPQMISSANTMKKAFNYLKEQMPAETIINKGTVIICTVEGDIHDIGKNIVAMMLENNGFKIVDLGKDIAKEIIVEKAIEHQADLILLSALLTTTMIQMKEVKKLLQEKNINIPVMVGGAVVTADYASDIGVGYSEDAAAAVNTALKILKKDDKK